MTIFNPENKQVLTFKELLDPAMEIKENEDAKQYLASYVEWLEAAWLRDGKIEKEPAINIAKSNLGYWAGYYSESTRKRVENLFECEHPIFGSIEKNGRPTAEEALKLGIKMGEESIKRNLK